MQYLFRICFQLDPRAVFGPAAGKVRRIDDRARDLPTPRVATLLTDPNPPFSPWRRDAEPYPRQKACAMPRVFPILLSDL